MFKGSFTALITPFEGENVDYDAYERLVEFQIQSGTHGLVPVGTTGEFPTLSHDEHQRVVETCIAAAKGRVPVIAGAGSNSTREAVALAASRKRPGRRLCSWSRPITTSRRKKGFTSTTRPINDAIGIPIIIYNIPGRSVVDMSVATMARLFKLPNIAGVKDATASPVRMSQQRLALGESFNQLSGEDATALAFMAHGGHGCISVTRMSRRSSAPISRTPVLRAISARRSNCTTG